MTATAAACQTGDGVWVTGKERVGTGWIAIPSG